MVDVADSEPGQAPPPAPTEPVRVAPLSEIQTRVAEAYGSLRREFGHGAERCLTITDEAGLREFEHQVATRVLQLHREGVALALLQALLAERLCGVSDKAIVKIPRQLLNRRLAAR